MTDTNTLAPTDAEILDAAEDFRSQYMHGGTTFDEFDEIGYTRAVLAKWGAPALASSEPDPMLPETKYNLGWASGWDAHAKAHPPEKPTAVPASGPVGFDHKTAANFLNGKTVTDEEVRQFVAHSRRAHDDRDWLRNTLADLRCEIARRDAEIALLKTSLLDVESPTQAAHAEQVDAVALELRSAPAGVEPVARIRYERNTPGRENEMPRVLSCNRMADGVYEVFTASQVQAALAAAPSGPVRVPLTAAQMAAGREAIFSTANPYCPCDSKTFRKVAEWVERHHGITYKEGEVMTQDEMIEECIIACEALKIEYAEIAASPLVTAQGADIYRAMSAGANNCMVALRELQAQYLTGDHDAS